MFTAVRHEGLKTDLRHPASLTLVSNVFNRCIWIGS